MNALHEQFIIEARELIQQATDDLLALEREAFSAERIDRVFRAFHTLKGSAGVVELPAMGLALHAAEDLLAAIHGGRLKASTAIVDASLSCLDQVARWVDDFEARGALSDAAGDEARLLAENLRRLLSAPKAGEPSRVGGGAADDSGAVVLPDWISRLIQSGREDIDQAMQEGATALTAVVYEPHPGCFFNGDDPLGLMRQVPRLLGLHVEAREPWPALALIDPYVCNVRIQAISAAERAELAAVFRLVPDQVRLIDIPSFALLPSDRRGLEDPAGLVRAVIAEQVQVLRALGDGRDIVGRIGAVTRVAANAMRYVGRTADAEQIAQTGSAAGAQADIAPLVAVLDAIISSLTQGGGAAPAEAGETTETAGRAVSRSLRVDETRIDALVNLAGELTIMKNGFAHLAKRVNDEAGNEEIARAVRREYEAFDRLAGEMNAAILQLRMVPVAQVFRSLPRLVRDMSQRLGKNVTLVTRGETTESDKTIVDHLFEPILHLVRNALDHGIETPEQRRAAGKPEAATIIVQASRAGDRFVLDVIDDGRGIDPATVRRKAAERGLLPPDELAALRDEQVIDLIFAAGFSTAAAVSDISGRGVGMDVVRNTIEQMSGRVSVSSRVGAGTTISLDLPLNIAMSRIMIVEAGGQVFGIPMDAVFKTVRLSPDRISKIKNNDGFVLDDRIVPICSLAELMNLPPTNAPARDVRLAVVAEVGGKLAALEVDAIRDRQEVVLKPMQGVLANAHGYAGTTLLGDGAILLVLDLKEIVP